MICIVSAEAHSVGDIEFAGLPEDIGIPLVFIQSHRDLDYDQVSCFQTHHIVSVIVNNAVELDNRSPDWLRNMNPFVPFNILSLVICNSVDSEFSCKHFDSTPFKRTFLKKLPREPIPVQKTG